ncbi:hypothetical protein ACSSS7_006567 [Eimeria intestinalis]
MSLSFASSGCAVLLLLLLLLFAAAASAASTADPTLAAAPPAWLLLLLLLLLLFQLLHCIPYCDNSCCWSRVFSVHNCSNIYQVPLLLDAQGLSARLMEGLGV